MDEERTTEESEIKECIVCFKKFEDNDLIAMDYPAGLDSAEFCCAGCLKKWLVKKEITLAVVALASLIAGIVVGGFLMGLLWMFQGIAIRQIVAKYNADGIEAITFLNIILCLTMVVPAIFMIKEIIQFVQLHKILKYESE